MPRKIEGVVKSVVDELMTNPYVIVGGLQSREDETPSLPCPTIQGFTLDIFVAPAQACYDAEELNDFMSEMIGDAKPACIDYFSLRFEGIDRPADQRLVLGRVSFRETIRRSEISNLPDQQLASVNLLPDVEHMLDALQGRNLYEIPTAQLGHGASEHNGRWISAAN